jgi:DNA adenine methylase
LDSRCIRLYAHSQLDHESLFHLTRSLTGDFLLTYDDTQEVRDLARQCHLDTEIVAMKTTHHAELNELLIGRNLDWARASCYRFQEKENHGEHGAHGEGAG